MNTAQTNSPAQANAPAQTKTKVAMITGYLGSGKTTLLNHILQNDEGIRAAVIVNDIGEVNIDAELVARNGGMAQAEDVVAMTNGCICCTLADDLAQQLTEIAESGQFDYIIIEASGICEPMPIAYTISGVADDEDEDYEEGTQPESALDLDNIVAVVDCARMWQEFNGGQDLTRDDLEQDDIENLLIQQIEFCSTILMNKADLVTPEQMAELKAIVRGLQKDAVMIETTQSKVDLKDILFTDRFDFERVLNSATWADAMDHPDDYDCEHHAHHHEEDGENGQHEHGEGKGDGCEHGHGEGHDHEHEHNEGHAHEHEGHNHGHHHHHGPGCSCGCDHDHPEVLEYHITTFVYRRRKPFNIERFSQLAQNWPDSVVRCKGYLWKSDTPDECFAFEQAGQQFYMTDSGRFVAAEPEETQQAILEQYPDILKDWDEELGDRQNKLVFIGRHMDRDELEAQLDACLEQ